MYSGIGELLSRRPPGGLMARRRDVVHRPVARRRRRRRGSFLVRGQETAMAGAGSATGCGLVAVRSVRTAGRKPANRTAKEMTTRALVLVAKPAPSPRAPAAIAAAAQRG